MMTIILTGIVVAFAMLFVAMALAPMAIEDVESEREIRSVTPVTYERQLPRAA